mmetsp:Transcript_21436/g.47619  ORF Transcript_21436/g.47619 Transcript_21436/m.47619 type:complete len:288 (-) Transcript_21436:871-1734(-)
MRGEEVLQVAVCLHGWAVDLQPHRIGAVQHQAPAGDAAQSEFPGCRGRGGGGVRYEVFHQEGGELGLLEQQPLRALLVLPQHGEDQSVQQGVVYVVVGVLHRPADQQHPYLGGQNGGRDGFVGLDHQHYDLHSEGSEGGEGPCDFVRAVLGRTLGVVVETVILLQELQYRRQSRLAVVHQALSQHIQVVGHIGGGGGGAVGVVCVAKDFHVCRSAQQEAHHAGAGASQTVHGLLSCPHQRVQQHIHGLTALAQRVQQRLPRLLQTQLLHNLLEQLGSRRRVLVCIDV